MSAAPDNSIRPWYATPTPSEVRGIPQASSDASYESLQRSYARARYLLPESRGLYAERMYQLCRNMLRGQ